LVQIKKDEKERIAADRRIKDKKERLLERKNVQIPSYATTQGYTSKLSKSSRLLAASTIALEIPKKLKLVDFSTEVRIKKERIRTATTIPDIDAELPPFSKVYNLTDIINMPLIPSASSFSSVIFTFNIESPFNVAICQLDDEFMLGGQIRSPSKQLHRLKPENIKPINIAELIDKVKISNATMDREAAEVSAEKLDYDKKLEQKLERAEIDLFKISKGLGNLLSGGAIIILAQERDKVRNCSNLLQEICRRLRRERGQSIYDPKVVSGKEEVEKHNLYDYCIFVLKSAELKDIVERRVLEFKRDCPSYLIIEAAQEKAEKVYSHVLKIKDKFLNNVLLLELADLSFDIFRSELAPILFGYLDLPDLSPDNSVDEVFGIAAQLYYRELERIKEEVSSKLDKYPIVKTSVGGIESNEHYWVKHFIVKYLVDDGIPKEDVETEPKLGDIVPDIYVRSKNVFIEVETLFGKGPNPIDRLRDEILDYPSNLELWIVMENFTMYLHLKEIFRLRNWLQEEGREIEFYTLDLKNRELIPIGNFVKDILKAFRIVVE